MAQHVIRLPNGRHWRYMEGAAADGAGPSEDRTMAATVEVKVWTHYAPHWRTLVLPVLPAGMRWEIIHDHESDGYSYTVRSRDGSCAVDIEIDAPATYGEWRRYYHRAPTHDEVQRSIEAAGYWMQPDNSRGSTGESWWAECA